MVSDADDDEDALIVTCLFLASFYVDSSHLRSCLKM
jgi:hypothetical protein